MGGRGMSRSINRNVKSSKDDVYMSECSFNKEKKLKGKETEEKKKKQGRERQNDRGRDE